MLMHKDLYQKVTLFSNINYLEIGKSTEIADTIGLFWTNRLKEHYYSRVTYLSQRMAPKDKGW